MLAALALVFAGHSALADDQASAPTALPAGLDEIVVTAQKRSEKAVNVPASLTVISGQDLAAGGELTTLDLTYEVPGLKMDRTGINTAPALRGVTSLVAAPGLDANVATYLDGVYSSDPAAILDLPDVQDIEVLKGPQGTLFGRNATGGAIQITTLKPTFNFNGHASFSYGNFDDQTFKLFVTGPLIGNTLAGSISLYEESNNGYLHDIINGTRTGAENAQLLRGKLLFQPMDNAEFTLTSYYSFNKNPAGSYGTPVNGITAAQAQIGAIVPTRPYDVATNIPATDTAVAYGVSLNGSIRTDPGTFTIIGDYDNHSATSANPAYYAYAPAGGYRILDTQPDESQSFEMDFASTQYGAFNYITGLYFYHDEASYSPVQIINDAPGYGLSIFGYQQTHAYAAFGELNYDLTDKLTAIVGVRYSAEYRSLEGTGGFGLNSSPPAPLTDFGHASFTAWTPRVSLRYALTTDTNAYFTFSQGFKSGGYDPGTVFGATPPIKPVLPEKLSAYEVGIKSAPTPRISLNAALFYYDYTDQQVSAFVESGGALVDMTENAASSKMYGADLESSAKITDELSLNTGISLLHARFDSFPAAVVNVPNYQEVNGSLVPVGNNAVSENVKGNELPRSPNWTISIGGKYVREFSPGTLSVKADVYRTDKLYFDPGNTYEQPAYTYLNAATSWELPRSNLTFTLWGKNLTNSVVVSGTFFSTTASAYNWAPPRTYGATVSTKF